MVFDVCDAANVSVTELTARLMSLFADFPGVPFSLMH